MKNTVSEIFLPEMDFCTELVLHSSPWVQKGGGSAAEWPRLLHLAVAEIHDLFRDIAA